MKSQKNQLEIAENVVDQGPPQLTYWTCVWHLCAVELLKECLQACLGTLIVACSARSGSFFDWRVLASTGSGAGECPPSLPLFRRLCSGTLRQRPTDSCSRPKGTARVCAVGLLFCPLSCSGQTFSDWQQLSFVCINVYMFGMCTCDGGLYPLQFAFHDGCLVCRCVGFHCLE